MNGLSLIPIFMIGLLGSVHCVGMCGGIVTALSTSIPQKPFPITVSGGALARGGTSGQLLYVLSYNTGRLGSYVLAGTIAGGAVSGMHALTNISAIRSDGYWLANLMLVILGLNLMGAWSGLVQLEKLGNLLWQHIQPLGKSLLPPDSPTKMFFMGALWGWLPCGMVYSVLLTAMLAGSPQGGAAVMLAFGLGTLPALFALGLLGTRLRNWSKNRVTRIACGLIVLGFGLLGLYRAAHGMDSGWLDVLCLHQEVRR